MADTAKPKRVGREESDPVDAFAVHHFEASLSVGGHLKKILTTGFRNEPQWKTTCRAIAAGTVAVLEPRGSGHNFTQGRIQITQPNIIRFRHMRVGVNNFLCARHSPPPVLPASIVSHFPQANLVSLWLSSYLNYRWHTGD